MTERMRFSFGNIAPSVILSTYPIGLIVRMTGPSHRANLIPSAGRIEGSPWRAADQRKERAEKEGDEKKKKPMRRRRVSAGGVRSVKMLIRGTQWKETLLLLDRRCHSERGCAVRRPVNRTVTSSIRARPRRTD